MGGTRMEGRVEEMDKELKELKEMMSAMASKVDSVAQQGESTKREMMSAFKSMGIMQAESRIEEKDKERKESMAAVEARLESLAQQVDSDRGIFQEFLKECGEFKEFMKEVRDALRVFQKGAQIPRWGSEEDIEELSASEVGEASKELRRETENPNPRIRVDEPQIRDLDGRENANFQIGVCESQIGVIVGEQRGLEFPRLKLPLFAGNNLLSWVSKVEKFFLINDVSEADKIASILLCFEGTALSWLQHHEARNPFQSWEKLKESLLQRFGISKANFPQEELFNLKQEGTGAEFREKFKSLFAEFSEVEDEWLKGEFLAGLNPNFRAVAKLFKPGTLNAVQTEISGRDGEEFRKVGIG